MALAMSARYYALVAGGPPGIAGLAHLYKDDSVCDSLSGEAAWKLIIYLCPANHMIARSSRYHLAGGT